MSLAGGAAATVAVASTFSGTFSGSATACLAPGFLRFGPRTRPLVMCCSSGAGFELSSCASLEENVAPSPFEEALLVAGSGPRASIPASAGLKRSASLPGLAESLLMDAGDCSGLLSRFGLSTLCKLFLRANASGWVFSSFGAGSGIGALEILFERLSRFCAAMASGVSAGLDMLSDRFSADPSSEAFTSIDVLVLIRLSLNSSRRTVGFGPPVKLREFFPRRMLSLRTSGATKFFVSVFLSLPNTF